MNDEIRFSDVIECGYCGTKARMRILGSVGDTEEDVTDEGLRFESGVVYEVYLCPSCKKPTVGSGSWHEGMEPSDWSADNFFPEPSTRHAHHLLEIRLAERRFMELAVAEARKSRSESDKISPLVGAVVARGNQFVASAYRGEFELGDHAEFTLLEKKCKNEMLTGSTVYTTLEPCTHRNLPKLPCVERLRMRKVKRVVVGMLDPDERIRGHGVLALRKANIHVDLFPPDLMNQLEEMNRDFIIEKERVGATALSVVPAARSTAASATVPAAVAAAVSATVLDQAKQIVVTEEGDPDDGAKR